MPTRNVNLTAEQDAFVEEVVRAGEYQNASEAIRDALRTLQQRRREESLKLKVLRKLVRTGMSDLDSGDFRKLSDADLEAYFEERISALGGLVR